MTTHWNNDGVRRRFEDELLEVLTGDSVSSSNGDNALSRALINLAMSRALSSGEKHKKYQILNSKYRIRRQKIYRRTVEQKLGICKTKFVKTF